MSAKTQHESETSWIVHDIIPLFEALGYPGAGDKQGIKINDVPVYRPSGGRSSSTMDIVYYHDGEPLLIVESKKPPCSHSKAVGEAKDYLRNFPRERPEYAKSGRAPIYLATTVGADIIFYKHSYDLVSGQLCQNAEPLDYPLRWKDLLALYDFDEAKKIPINDKTFALVFTELVSIYLTEQKKVFSPTTILKVVRLIIEFLKDSENYTSRQPYVSLDKYPDRQKRIRSILDRYNWERTDRDIALSFRSTILSAFQGSKNLNQYITPWQVVQFMASLADVCSEDMVLDFECGSGGFLAAALERGVPMDRLLGVDISDLPYYVSTLFIALYSNTHGSAIDTDIPCRRGNGLFALGEKWDVVLSNPAGGVQYDPHHKLGDIQRVYKYLARDLDADGKDEPASEYNFSVQQAIRSVKVGGRICLVLPEGLFANTTAEVLRKFIVKHCLIEAVISLPRGIFSVGATTKTVSAGARTSSQKMSILYARKIKDVVVGEPLDVDKSCLDYNVFLSSVAKPTESTSSTEWLKDSLDQVLDEYKEWRSSSDAKAMNLAQVFKLRYP